MLTLEEKLIYTRVKKAAIIWLLMIRLDPQPLNESLASEILQIDRSTARGYLKTLSELHIAARLGRYEGYTLTDTGKQLSLPQEFRRLLERAREEIPPSPLNAFNEDFNDLNTLNTSLTLIKSDGGNSPFEGGNSPFEPETCENCGSVLAPGDKYCKNCGKPVENEAKPTGEEIDSIVKRLLEAQPEKKALLDQLLFCRIKINWKTLPLLYSEDLNAQEVRAQFDFLKERGRERETGILITNLLSEFRPRGEAYDPKTGHLLNCTCYRCIGSRNERFFEERADQAQNYQSWEDD